MPNVKVLVQLLKAQFGGHARIHLASGDLRHIRFLDSAQIRQKKSSNVFSIVERLPIYAGSCATMVRGGFLDLKQAGMILLVRASSGLPFHVELGGPDEQLAVTRVSTGAIARGLEKAIQRAGKPSAAQSRALALRVFRIAGMHVSAVWIHHPKKQGADVFVPYTPNFARLRLGQTYKLRRFESLLKKHAIHMILHWYHRYENSLTQPKG